MAGNDECFAVGRYVCGRKAYCASELFAFAHSAAYGERMSCEPVGKSNFAVGDSFAYAGRADRRVLAFEFGRLDDFNAGFGSDSLVFREFLRSVVSEFCVVAEQQCGYSMFCLHGFHELQCR